MEIKKIVGGGLLFWQLLPRKKGGCRRVEAFSTKRESGVNAR